MELKADPKNPNHMAGEDKARMDKSLSEFGDLGCVILNRRTGYLIGGHQRVDVMAGAKIDAKDLKRPEPDGTVARGWLTYKGRKFALRVVDWDETKAHAAMLAANRFGRVGSDDAEKLQDIIKELDGIDFDMDLTGYDYNDLGKILNQRAPKEGEQESGEGLPTLAAEIAAEKEWTEKYEAGEKRAEKVQTALKKIRETRPELIANGGALVLSAGTNECQLIVDESLADVLTELRRYAETGEPSPLGKLLESVYKL
jgi:hypothetical protein